MKRMKQHLAALLAAALLAAPLAVPAAAGVYGDVDGDGTLGVLDVITLQKWIHGLGTLPSARAADLDRSGIVDIFDLAMVKNALFAEGISESSVELTKVGASAETAPLTEDFRDAQRKFAVELMQHTMKEGKNVLVSPYSVMQALAMTDAGAVGDTRTAMDNALGGLAYESLAPQLGTYRLGQPDMLQTANSVWFRDDADRIQVAPAFLEECAGRFGASAFAAPFDQTTVDDINLWIRDRTARMIPHMIDELSDDTVMALVNAVSFDAKWMKPYDAAYAVHDDTFTNAKGEAQTVPFMWSEEHAYLEDAHATGFLKYYDDGRYAFAAILPEDGLTPEAYLAGLDAVLASCLAENPDSPEAYLTALKEKLPEGMKLEKDQVFWTEKSENRALECAVKVLEPGAEKRTVWTKHVLLAGDMWEDEGFDDFDDFDDPDGFDDAEEPEETEYPEEASGETEEEDFE